jgi:hypothetical protein
VYVVKREDGKGSTRTLHRNFLLPFTCISPESYSNTCTSSVSKQVKKTQEFIHSSESSSDSDSSAEESDSVYIIPQRRQRNRGQVQDPSSLSANNSSAFQSLTGMTPSNFAPSNVSATNFIPSPQPILTPPQRSARTTRPPDRYSDWQYCQMVPQQFIRLETLV